MELQSLDVTCCELSNDSAQLAADWDALTRHCQATQTDVLLLPEMPLSPWLGCHEHRDESAWAGAVAEHQQWRERFSETGAKIVIGTEPVVDDGVHFNEGFVWTPDTGYQAVHRKRYLPNEAYFWEANWYCPGEKSFEPVEVAGIKIGFLICTEMWFFEWARRYGQLGLDLLVCPRATGKSSADKWLAGGRAAATCSGAFCLSANRGGTEPDGFEWGSQAWIIHPEEADVLAVSSIDHPFITQTINLDDAATAKKSYPRYVKE